MPFFLLTSSSVTLQMSSNRKVLIWLMSSLFIRHCHCMRKMKGSWPISRVLCLAGARCLSFIYTHCHQWALAVYPPTWGEQPSLVSVYMTLQLLRCTARMSPCGWWALTPPSHPYLIIYKAVLFFCITPPSQTAFR